ncbi:MAG: methionyl-tRNA formyltransferase [Pseudomonadota bacterium]
MNYLIITSQQWNFDLFDKLQNNSADKWFLISEKDDVNLEKINQINPLKIFFPHWSYYIKEEIFQNYECIVFHMTDLPYGRGGSPLQNLISRGVYNTKISALRCTKELDAGDIYLKRDLSLKQGNAEELYIKASQLVFEMIIEIIIQQLKAVPQQCEGEVVNFKRRTAAMSLLPENLTLMQVYDHIRMLDAPSYPKAYIDYGGYRLHFEKAQLSSDQQLQAQVRFEKIE